VEENYYIRGVGKTNFIGSLPMSGHSKWATIKHKKAKEDAKRGKVFTKLIKEITVAARLGGGDLGSNAKLRMIVDKAKAENMPLDNITRAIKKGTGTTDGAQYEEIVYEGHGPHGTAVIVKALTDNKNRMVATLRHAFMKMGGALGETGSVSWMFERKGIVRLNAANKSEDDLLEKLIDYNVEDVIIIDNVASVICAVEDLEKVKKGAEKAGLVVEAAELEWVAKSKIEPKDEEQESKVFKFLEALEELDDVQNVFTNLA
jgi:YebC/PmpR family DNA-binding regulatory protein